MILIGALLFSLFAPCQAAERYTPRDISFELVDGWGKDNSLHVVEKGRIVLTVVTGADHYDESGTNLSHLADLKKLREEYTRVSEDAKRAGRYVGFRATHYYVPNFGKGRKYMLAPKAFVTDVELNPDIEWWIKEAESLRERLRPYSVRPDTISRRDYTKKFQQELNTVQENLSAWMEINREADVRALTKLKEGLARWDKKIKFGLHRPQTLSFNVLSKYELEVIEKKYRTVLTGWTGPQTSKTGDAIELANEFLAVIGDAYSKGRFVSFEFEKEIDGWYVSTLAPNAVVTDIELRPIPGVWISKATEMRDRLSSVVKQWGSLTPKDLTDVDALLTNASLCAEQNPDSENVLNGLTEDIVRSLGQLGY